MVWAGTPVITRFTSGSTPALLVTFSGLDANSEFGIIDTWTLGMNWTPRAATCLVTRTAGTTNAIDVDVDVSMDGTIYTTTDINNITAKDTYESHPAAGAADDKGRHSWRYWKPVAVAVGAGNTLEIELWLYP